MDYIKSVLMRRQLYPVAVTGYLYHEAARMLQMCSDLAKSLHVVPRPWFIFLTYLDLLKYWIIFTSIFTCLSYLYRFVYLFNT